jgi:hypothetical protein
MVHAALLLLMLEAVTTDIVFTISLKRSTQNIQLSTSCRPITPSKYSFNSTSTEKQEAPTNMVYAISTTTDSQFWQRPHSNVRCS